jgi:DNA polymerase-1
MTTGLDGVKLELVDSVEKASQFLTWIGERRPLNAIAVDIETGEFPGNHRDDAFSPWHGCIRLIQVGDGMTGWSIPWEEWNGVFYEGMRRFDGQIVCHNIAFEARWFAVKSKWDLPWHRAHDTMIMAHLIDPLGSGALKRLTSQYVDANAARMQQVLDDGMAKNGWTWGTVPINYQPYWAYGALDTVLTMRLFEKFWEKCGPGQAYSVAYELEMNTRRIATRMELNGARLDLDYSKKKYQELVDYTEQVKVWAKGRYNGMSITSNVQLVRQLELLGAEITEFTPSGNKSASADQLKFLALNGTPEVQELASTALKQRKADKLASTYFSNFITDNINGFVHPSIRTMGARTGRMTIQNPALQTLPKGDDTVRRAFIPRDEDHLIITSDLDQVEFRMFATMSNDQNLIDLFNMADATGSDPFTEIGREVYQDPTMVKSDKRRGLIKGVVYGRLYGAGVAKQAMTAGVPEDQMRAVSDAFDVNYPGMKFFQKQVEEVGMQRLRDEGQAYVKTWTGHRIPSDDDRIYSLTNYLIQGSAAEIFKSNLVKLDQADLTELMIVPVHDEIVLNAPREDVEEIKQLVRQCMTTTEGWAVPLTADVEGGYTTWGSKYEG